MTSEKRKIWKEFFKIYREHPVIWKTKNFAREKNELKDAAYEDLLNILKKLEPSANICTVKAKLRMYRFSYRRELKRVISTEKSGAKGSDIYQPRLWYYEDLNFLRNQIEMELDPKKISKTDKKLSKRTFDTFGWTRENILALIEDYRKNPCLWNPKDAHYNDKTIRNAALATLAKKYNVNVKKVQTIISNLRHCFKRIKSKHTGKGSPCWFAYRSMCFLEDFIYIQEDNKWPRQTLLSLIKDYQANPVLWDPKNPGYSNPSCRRAALCRLSKKYNRSYDRIKERLVSLRRSFGRAFKKMKDEGTYSKWFAYRPLSFLLTSMHESLELEEGAECTSVQSHGWTRANVLALIEDYRKNPCFWNPKVPHYTDKAIRKAAFATLAKKYKVNVSKIHSKIGSLRQRFKRNKIKHTGKGSPCWFAYRSMCFLDDFIYIHEDNKWPKQTVLSLIKDYQANPVLWDPKNPDYSNPSCRRAAYDGLSKKYNHSCDRIKQRLYELRKAFRRAFKRMRDGGTDSIKWFAYRPLSFLLTSMKRLELKEGGECKRSVQSNGWARANVFALIEDYRENPCLWNPRVPDYTDKAIREAAFATLAKKYKVTVSKIRAKIGHLRHRFKRSKIKHAVKGSPHWYAYRSMCFLDDVIYIKEDKKWPRQTLLSLIKDYQANPVLWDPKNPGYSSPSCRRVALYRLSKKYNRSYDRINDRLLSLRQNFGRAFRRMKDEGTDSKWFAYRPLSFLLTSMDEGLELEEGAEKMQCEGNGDIDIMESPSSSSKHQDDISLDAHETESDGDQFEDSEQSMESSLPGPSSLKGTDNISNESESRPKISARECDSVTQDDSMQNAHLEVMKSSPSSSIFQDDESLNTDETESDADLSENSEHSMERFSPETSASESTDKISNEPESRIKVSRRKQPAQYDTETQCDSAAPDDSMQNAHLEAMKSSPSSRIFQDDESLDTDDTESDTDLSENSEHSMERFSPETSSSESTDKISNEPESRIKVFRRKQPAQYDTETQCDSVDDSMQNAHLEVMKSSPSSSIFQDDESLDTDDTESDTDLSENSEHSMERFSPETSSSESTDKISNEPESRIKVSRRKRPAQYDTETQESFSDEDSEFLKSLHSQHKRKLSKNYSITQDNYSSDEDSKFSKSLLPHARRIPEDKKLLFRNEVLELLQQYACAE